MRGLTGLPGPNLTDDEKKAFGEIVSYWSLAELSLDIVLLVLALHPVHKRETAKWARKRTGPFKDKVKAFKKLLRITCEQRPEIVELGLDLARTGKALSKRGGEAMHWPASRSDPAADDLSFVAMDLLKGEAQKKKFSAKDLYDLAGEIADWWLGLNQFMLRVSEALYGAKL
jgi:hypothetical protein